MIVREPWFRSRLEYYKRLPEDGHDVEGSTGVGAAQHKQRDIMLEANIVLPSLHLRRMRRSSI